MADRRSVHQCINNYPYNGSRSQFNLEASCKNSLDFVQRLAVMKTMNVHNGCVNTVNWNASGTLIVSGSDDHYLVVTEAKNGHVLARTKTQHKRHIFSARFMPHSNDLAFVSCSGDGSVMHTEFLAPYRPGCSAAEALIGETGRQANLFDCHSFGSTYDVLPFPDSQYTFISCGEDGTVRSIDLRETSRCSESVCSKHIYITAPCAVTAMDVAPINHYKIAIGCSDSIVRLFDRRMLASGTDGERITWPVKAYPIPMKYTHRHYRPTCVKYSADESELLVSYSMEQLYLFDLNTRGFSDAELLRSDCYTPKMRRDGEPEPQLPRLRFRGDWSDTGPNATISSVDPDPSRLNVGQARPPLEPGVLSRLSDEIFRMLNTHTQQIRALHSNSVAVRNRRTIVESNGGGYDGPAISNASGTAGSTASATASGTAGSTASATASGTAGATASAAAAAGATAGVTAGAAAGAAAGRNSNNNTNSPPLRSFGHMSWQDAVMHTMDRGHGNRVNIRRTNNSPSPAIDNVPAATAAAQNDVPWRPDAATAAAAKDSNTNEEEGDESQAGAVGGTDDLMHNFEYVKMIFNGHRNSRTVMKAACFWGDDYVMSGSDCGHIFVWERKTGKVVKTLLADQHVVNRVQPHPTLPYLLSSGIDYNYKIWAPVGAKPCFDETAAAELVKNNEIMLVETRDTITVPAQIMIRILASLHQYRRLMYSNDDGVRRGRGRSEISRAIGHRGVTSRDLPDDSEADDQPSEDDNAGATSNDEAATDDAGGASSNVNPTNNGDGDSDGRDDDDNNDNDVAPADDGNDDSDNDDEGRDVSNQM